MLSVMPNHLQRAIKRTDKQIRKQQVKYTHSKELTDKIAAKDEIRRLKSKRLRIEQQIIFNEAKAP